MTPLGPVVTVTPEPPEVATGTPRVGLCGLAHVAPGTVVTELVDEVAGGW